MSSSVSGRRIWAWSLGAVAAAALLLVGTSPAFAQEGAIQGTVTEAESGQPLSGVQVFIRGTNIGTLTGQDGSYRLTDVPTGDQRLRARRIGYRTVTREVGVSSGQVSTVDIEMTQSALELQDVVVTGVAAETPQTKLPFTVNSLDTEDIPVPSSDMSGILQGKAAGISVVSSSGQPGGESDILLRGQTSINAAGRSQSPLIVIDGVIQSTSASLSDLNSMDIENIEVVKGAAAASMYGSRAQNGVIQITTKSGADLQESDQNIDITLRAEGGRSDLPKEWPTSNRHVLAMNANQTSFVNSAGEEVGFGEAVTTEDACGGGAPRCFQDNPWPNPTDNFDEFFDPGSTSSLYGAVAGATGNTNFRASAEYFDETGNIRQNDGYERINGRLNVSHSVDDFEIQGTMFAARSKTDELGGGGNGESGNAFFGILFMSPGADIDRKTKGAQRGNEECTGGPENDCWFVAVPDPTNSSDRLNPLFTEQTSLNTSEKKRLMGSVQATWEPLNWFSLDGTFSYDRTDDNFESFVRKNTPEGQGAGRSRGELFRNDFYQEAINASATANFNRTWLDDQLTTRLRLRYLVEDQETNSFSAGGDELATEGIRNLGALVDNSTFNLGSNFTTIRSQNFFAIGSLDYKDRYIVDGLVRRDGSSLFGPGERWQTYFRASGAYRVSEEPWFDISGVDNFKLRYSIGTAGSRPNFFQQYEVFNIGAGGSLQFGTLGNESLSPERSTEQEVGFNLALADMFNISGTYAKSVTEDQLLPVPLPGFFGFSTQWQNAGELETETWEAQVEAQLVQTENFGWNSTVSASTTDETITELNVPAFKYGPTVQGGQNAFFAREGENLGTFYGTVWAQNCSDIQTTFGIDQSTCQSQFDVNDNGQMVWVGEGNDFRSGPGPDGEVQTSDDLWGTAGTVNGETFEFGEPLAADRVDQTCLENNPDASQEECTTNFLPMGSSNPDIEVSFANTVRWKGFSVYGLLDAATGFQVYNNTRQWANSPRTRGAGTEFSDQVGKPEGLKKPLVYYDSWTYNGNNFNTYFVEDGDYLKLRELSVSYQLPQNIIQSVFGGAFDGASVSVLGRNLVTWTDYTGYDPEVGFGNASGNTGQTGSAANARFAAFQWPNMRTVSATLELTF